MPRPLLGFAVLPLPVSEPSVQSLSPSEVWYERSSEFLKFSGSLRGVSAVSSPDVAPSEVGGRTSDPPKSTDVGLLLLGCEGGDLGTKRSGSLLLLMSVLLEDAGVVGLNCSMYCSLLRCLFQSSFFSCSCFLLLLFPQCHRPLPDVLGRVTGSVGALGGGRSCGIGGGRRGRALCGGLVACGCFGGWPCVARWMRVAISSSVSLWCFLCCGVANASCSFWEKVR